MAHNFHLRRIKKYSFYVNLRTKTKKILFVFFFDLRNFFSSRFSAKKMLSIVLFFLMIVFFCFLFCKSTGGGMGWVREK